MKYLVSDIHGMYDKFIAMIDKIGFSENDKMYIIGDVVDRGKEPIKCLQYVMSKPNIEMILGNHEDMMYRALVDNDDGYYNCWMNNGGLVTLNQFKKLSDNEQINILDYIIECPLYKIIDDKYILVHAGLDFYSYDSNEKLEVFLNSQSYDALIWDRPRLISHPIQGYTIIIGHSPTVIFDSSLKPMTILNKNNWIDIDCGSCFRGGQLGCLRLDDMAEFYV